MRFWKIGLIGLGIATSAGALEVDPALEKNVQFWFEIYTRYSVTEGVIHDARDVDRIYEVLKFKNPAQKPFLVQSRRRYWRKVLLSLHQKQASHRGKGDSVLQGGGSSSRTEGRGSNPDPTFQHAGLQSWVDSQSLEKSRLTPDEKKVYSLFPEKDGPSRFLNAAHRKRIRFQLGQKEYFREGFAQSKALLPAMEQIFRAEDLPIELTRIPFVESSFNVKALSKVGASGIWQLMRSTGKQYLVITETVDERNDPLKATRAAAQLLKENYAALGNWELAVTAYNHGRKSLLRAVPRAGSTRLVDLWDTYRTRSFGFASRNFFTEVLGAIEAEKALREGRVP